MKVWITKYALTTGVVSYNNAKPRGDAMIEIPPRSKGGYIAYFHGNDWHTSEETAKNRVREMIKAKRQSLTRQLAKLDKLELSLGRPMTVSRG